VKETIDIEIFNDFMNLDQFPITRYGIYNKKLVLGLFSN
jgi:hypothetical protein